MKKLNLFPVMCALALAACGDDAEPTDTTDAGTDSADEGSGGDVTPDEGSADVDTTDEGSGEPDEEVGPPAEICDNDTDDDEDGDTDCADSDCASLPVCPQDEVCDDATDNDLDGAVDCLDTDCEAAEVCNCPEGTVARGGGCSAPVSADDTYSYIRNLHIPGDTEEPCCFDFDGDGELDNGLGALIGLVGVLAADVNIDDVIAEALADDSIALLMGWTGLPDSHNFSIYLATNDVDGDGTPDQEFSERAAGNGVFTINEESLDEWGGVIQFNNTTYTAPVFQAGPGEFRLNLPIDTDGFSLNLDLTIQDTTIRGPIAESTTGIESEDDAILLGGVVPLDQIFSILNDLAADCTCAEFDPTMPVITYEDNGTEYLVTCAQTPTGDCAGGGTVCENLGLVCSLIGQLVPVFGLGDIDTNGNGVVDALSVGLQLSLTGATVADGSGE